jgi:hypothetical protein
MRLKKCLQSVTVQSANCVRTYTVACRRALSSAPLYLIGSRPNNPDIHCLGGWMEPSEIAWELWKREHFSCWSTINNHWTLWPESAAKYTDRSTIACRQSLPTFVDRGRHVVIVMGTYGRILGFLDRSRYYLFQVTPQLYSRGWVDSVPNPLLLRKCVSAGNRNRTSGSVFSQQ